MWSTDLLRPLTVKEMRKLKRPDLVRLLLKEVASLTRTECAEGVLAAMAARYYRPRSMPAAAQVCLGVGGAGIFDPE